MKASVRSRLERLTIRRRLAIGLVVLVAVVLAAVGFATVRALQVFLLGQVDQQLEQTSARLVGPRRTADLSGQPMGTLAVLIGTTGAVDAALVFVPRGEAPPPLSDADKQELVSASQSLNEPQSVDLSGQLGSYRVVAEVLPNGETLVTGLPLGSVNKTVGRLLLVEVVVFAAALVVVGALGAWLVRLGLRPLNRITVTARRVAALPLDRGQAALPDRVPVQAPNTEVGQVSEALNVMLGHVDDAFAARAASEQRLRRFVADASHELRTPLASIRGYAELFRRAPTADPDDLARAMRRVEGEAERMSELVEDLLLLARLDQGRPLDLKPVDVALLAADAVSDAQAADASHRWALDVPPEPLLVCGDEHRLRQVLANLLSNARIHTPAGTSVRVGIKADGPWAVLAVHDDGPGFPPDLLPRAFDRFTRADSSRSRDSGGVGLGLAIVAAVVSAHRGEVMLRSVPGDTTLLVRLPRDGAAPRQPGAPPAA
ncbi:MAG: sensor histidine kinase [Frankiaceae bacterium]